jgi:hypothetical protein
LHLSSQECDGSQSVLMLIAAEVEVILGRGIGSIAQNLYVIVFVLLRSR